MAVVHQQGRIRLDTDEYRDAIVTLVNGNGTVTLVALSNGANWGDGHAGSQGTIVYTEVAVGTGIGEWQPGGYLAGELEPYCEAPVAGIARSLTIGSDFQATDTSRPARFVISGTWSVALAATGSIAGAVQLKAGASANPSVVVDDAHLGFSATLLLGVALTPTLPWKLDYELPAGHYGRPSVLSGSGFTITNACEQAR